MNLQHTDITIVLDRSGSMGGCENATIEAVNGYIKGQEQAPGTCNVSLIQFDDKYEPNYISRSVKEIIPLNRDTYQPRGGTALRDAIGRAIEETGSRIRSMPEHARPGTVIFLIQTDGHENSSRKFNQTQINDMIAHQRDKYNWTFVFLGANIDAIASATSYGIQADYALSYNKNNTEQVFAVNNNKTYSLRSAKFGGNSMATYEGFSATERSEAENV